MTLPTGITNSLTNSVTSLCICCAFGLNESTVTAIGPSLLGEDFILLILVSLIFICF